MISQSHAIVKLLKRDWQMFLPGHPMPAIGAQQVPDGKKFKDIIVATDTGGTQYSDRINVDIVNFQLFIRNCKASNAREQAYNIHNYLNSADFILYFNSAGELVPDDTDPDYHETLEFILITPTVYPTYIGITDDKLRQWSINYQAHVCQSENFNRF